MSQTLPRTEKNRMQLAFCLVIACAVLPVVLAQPATYDTKNSTTGASHTITTNGSGIITKPGCDSVCGDVIVPYPFGIGVGKGCSIGRAFDINCSTSHKPPKAFIVDSNIEVYEITDTQLRISTALAVRCYNQFGTVTEDIPAGTRLSAELPFSFSDANVFTLVGCDDYAYISGSEEDDFISGCSSQTEKVEHVPNNECLGACCCQVSIKALQRYDITLDSFANHTNVSSFDACSYAFLGEKTRFTFGGASDLNNNTSFSNRVLDNVPIVLDWVIGTQTCDQARNSNDFACKFENTECINSNGSFSGYHCSCLKGYEGHPYLSPGCKDINECDDPSKNDCDKNYCHNTPGGYTCPCPHGYKGDGRKNGTGCYSLPRDKSDLALKFSLGVGFGLLFLIIGISWLCFIIKRRKATLLREKFFRENGGMLLRQQTTSSECSVKSTREFTVEQLKKATNNFAVDMVIGRGGYGIVYKGVLHDNRVVAIKKSRVMDKNQVEQFINEVVILTKINHRNIVKLLGCCLESEVPMLVYEFVSNGNLSDHIHTQKGIPWLSFENRLRIAAESAGALAYLHSAASMPIIHRDVKSANILLDDSHVTKISDFGASRLVPLDQTQVTTLVQGTLGYLDPEYSQTGQLTDKSDVYSFGVVLAELLTGKKPLVVGALEQEKNLATLFLTSLEENRLFEILEPRVMTEGTSEQLETIAHLVKRCLKLSGNERPTMKEMAVELESLWKFVKQSRVTDQYSHGTTSKAHKDLPEIRLGSYATSGENNVQQSSVTSN